MLRERIYYTIKPIFPWRVRMAVRRFFARRKRPSCAQIWPIDESAGRQPEGWPGWPDGKQFAFVLTHDIEGPDGLEKCHQLAELEMELGFRSSFNFIPEGGYTVPPSLRDWLTERGFEVGVHDLEHDGRLFVSRRGFKQKAVRINRYLREWNAAGFRAGFMLRNLEWLHQLEIQYDSSTFDTDPFELQSDGVDTIYPFWIPAPAAAEVGRVIPNAPSHEGRVPDAPSDLSRRIRDNPPYPLPDSRASSPSSPSPFPLTASSAPLSPSPSLSLQPSPRAGLPSVASAKEGYVELPYTLPQDSTLFLVLRETTPQIWLQKLDWIAAHGGMTLVDVHPDYMSFDGGRHSNREYPVRLYVELLQHAIRKHAGQFWNPTPRELAAWFKGTRKAGDGRPVAQATTGYSVNGPVGKHAGLRGKRAAVLLYSDYPSDPRPRRAAEAMVESGMEVDLLCLSENKSDQLHECVGGVQVFRLPLARLRGGKISYLWQYSRFILSSFWFLARRSPRRRYDLVHVHNMPDVLVFSALVPKLLGAKIILDLHDPMPELMMTIFGARKDSFEIRVLQRFERWSLWFADAVITVNEACKKLFAARSCLPGKVHVVMNSPDEKIFQHREPPEVRKGYRTNGARFAIMYHGSLVERHGLDLAIEALRKIKPSIPGAELWIYGQETPFLRRTMAALEQSPLREAVHYCGPKNLEQIVKAINACDVGVIPNRRSIFTEINTPTRIFEYLSQGKPVVAPRAGGILDYFGPQDLVYFELGDSDDLAEKLDYVFRQPAAMGETVRRGQSVYLQHCWSRERLRFLDSVAEALGVDGRSAI
jgi:glycosyltransferase involved in cell wall biosynthesis